MAKEKITHSICVGGPLTIHTDLATGRIRRVRPIVLTDDDAPGWVIKAHGKESVSYTHLPAPRPGSCNRSGPAGRRWRKG